MDPGRHPGHSTRLATGRVDGSSRVHGGGRLGPDPPRVDRSEHRTSSTGRSPQRRAGGRWAYYVSPQFVDGASGFYQVSLAMACSHNSRRHLGNAVTLLTPEAMAAPDYWSPRDALLGGTALVKAYLGLGEPAAPF